MIPLPRGEFFVPMEAYLDESGIHEGASTCVIAGCAGGRQKFKSFELRWEDMLGKFGIPAAKGFHAKDFFNRSKERRRYGIYASWDSEKSFDLIDAMVKLIGEHKLNPVGSCVDVSLFRAQTHNFRRWLTGGIYDEQRGKWLSSGAPQQPYFYLFHHATIAGCRAATDGVTVDFLFDRQENFAGLALDLWNRLKGLPNSNAAHLGGIGFYSRIERVSLQAADLVAFCAYNVGQYKEDAERTDIRYAISKLLGVGMQISDCSKAIPLLYPLYPAQLKEEDEQNRKEVA